MVANVTAMPMLMPLLFYKSGLVAPKTMCIATRRQQLLATSCSLSTSFPFFSSDIYNLFNILLAKNQQNDNHKFPTDSKTERGRKHGALRWRTLDREERISFCICTTVLCGVLCVCASWPSRGAHKIEMLIDVHHEQTTEKRLFCSVSPCLL